MEEKQVELIPAKPLLSQTAMVTGASRGIGAAIARLLAAGGASLFLTELAERMANLEAYAASLRETFSVEVVCSELDVRSTESIREAVSKAEASYGRLDILVNNAGVNFLTPALKITPEQWDDVVDVNLKGNFFVTQEAAKLMLKNKSGSIVMIASQHGVVGNEHRAPYCASKAGLINLAKSLAYEWARYNIRVNTVSPTFVSSPENEAILSDPAFKRTNLPKIPLRQFATPEDVAQAVLYLVSPAAKMVTGHNLLVDGGWTAI